MRPWEGDPERGGDPTVHPPRGAFGRAGRALTVLRIIVRRLPHGFAAPCRHATWGPSEQAAFAQRPAVCGRRWRCGHGKATRSAAGIPQSARRGAPSGGLEGRLRCCESLCDACRTASRRLAVTPLGEPLNKPRPSSAPLFVGGDGVAAMGRRPGAGRGSHSPPAAGCPSGEPKGRAGCVAAHCVRPAARLRRAPCRHALWVPLSFRGLFRGSLGGLGLPGGAERIRQGGVQDVDQILH